MTGLRQAKGGFGLVGPPECLLCLPFEHLHLRLHRLRIARELCSVFFRGLCYGSLQPVAGFLAHLLESGLQPVLVLLFELDNLHLVLLLQAVHAAMELCGTSLAHLVQLLS